MQIQVNARGVNLPETFDSFAEERIREGLEHFASQLTRVEVHFTDLNAGKGGADKRCMIEARPRGMDPIAVEVVSTKESDSLRLALDKMRSALERRLDRRSSKR